MYRIVSICCLLITVQVNITISDVNDNPPVIAPVDLLTVLEGSSYGADSPVLTRLIATDSDASSQLEFAISSNPYGSFAINDQGRPIVCTRATKYIVEFNQFNFIAS